MTHNSMHMIIDERRADAFLAAIKGPKPRPLGKTQKDVLRALVEHESWKGHGWVWTTYRETRKVIEGLVKRDLAELRDGVFYPTEAGKTEAARRR